MRGGGVERRTTAYFSARQKWRDQNFNKKEEPYKGPNYGRKGLRSKYRSSILLLRRRRKYELGGQPAGRAANGSLIIIKSYLPCAPPAAPLPSLISAASLALLGSSSSKFHRGSFVWHLILIDDDERRKMTTFGRQRLTDNGTGDRSGRVSPPPAASEGYRHTCLTKTLPQFCNLHSSVSCINAIQKKQLKLYAFASSCFSVTACTGQLIGPAAVKPMV